MKTFNSQVTMNSRIHLPATIQVAASAPVRIARASISPKLVLAALCLAWLAAPNTAPAQTTNPQAKLELVEQVQKLTASDGHISAFFGCSSAISGDTAVFGAFGFGTGSAYVFVWQGTNWVQQQKLTPSDGASGSWFGYSVGIDGNTIVVGDMQAHQGAIGYGGAAYVFVRTGSTWAQQQKLTPSNDNHLTDYDRDFGTSVAISGNTIIAGAPGYTSEQGKMFYGAAYVFDRSGSTWTQMRVLTASDGSSYDHFGCSVAVNGGVFVVGAYGRSSTPTAWDYRGAAYVFNRDNNWAQTTLSFDPVPGGLFGASVAISSDTIVVGNSHGSAYVYGNPGFVRQQVLTPSDGSGQAQYGEPCVGCYEPVNSVAVSGDAIVLGPVYADTLPPTNRGAAYLFVREGSTWMERRKFTASDGAAGDLFGAAVAVSGATVVVGAPGQNTHTGAAYVFAPGYGQDTNVASYVRRLLYVPDAAASRLFNPWDAAFLYKHRLYGWGTNAQGANVIQPQFEHISDYWPGPSGVYLTRSREAEAELRQGLAQNPGSDLLGDLLLDIYYDRTAADSLFARDALASADKARFGGPGLTIANPPAPGHFVIENEIAAHEAVLRTNRMVLSNYLALVRDPAAAAFFQRLVPNRGLKPATYLVTNLVDGVPVYEERSVIGDNTPLFTGYKDLVLVSGLLRDYGQTAVALARLYVARGDTAAANNLITGTQRLLTLQSSLWRGFFPSLTLPANDASGLAEALSGINNSLADLEAVKQNLEGAVNPLGFANDFLMFVQRRSSDPDQGDTFDILRALLAPDQSSSSLKLAVDELTGDNGLEASYRLYRDSQDEMAAQFADSCIAYNDRLRDIVGVFPDDPRYTDLATANRGSDLDLQYRKVDLARNRILHNQTQMDNLTQQMQIEIDKATFLSNIVVKYAAKRAAITEKIGHLSAAQAEISAFADACSPENIATGGAIVSILNGGAQATGEEMKAQLEAEKERLAGDEQAEVLGAELNATVKGLMLDMNILLIESREAALTLQQEVNGLQALYREKQDLERKLVQRDNRLSRRYFADPVHRLSVQAGMVRADQSFENAQRWLFFMVRALEYKYNEPFLTDEAPDGRPLWTSTDIYQLRNATELQDCYNAMTRYDERKTVVWTFVDWDVFSIRKNAFGYLAGTNAQGQPLRYVVDVNGSPSPPLDATNAFRARLWQEVTDLGNGPKLVLHFNTARTVGNLFLGPTFTTNQPPTPTLYGTYLDKINEMRVRLAGNHSRPDGEVSQVSLTYGGTSYIRKPVVGEYASDRPDRLCNETTTYSTRFWQSVGSPPRWEAIEALRVEGQKALRSRTAPPPSEGPTIKKVIEFSDRSVAASDWTLTIPLEGDEGANFLIDELDDIEIYFQHRAATRTQTQ